MKKNIAILAGDGIGPEVMAEAIKVLLAVAERFGHRFDYEEALIGGAAYDQHGEHFPDSTFEACQNADAILFGSVGGPVGDLAEKWRDCEVNSILALRKKFGFTVNLRPTKVYEPLKEHCVLRGDIVEKGIDILCVRELSGGIYFGEHKLFDDKASDIMSYDRATIEYVVRAAFEAAKSRRRKVASVDKANVLACSKLWRFVVLAVSKDYPQCEVEHVLVDNMAMQVLTRPHDFDVVVMPNLFGDIISDEVSVFAGSLGMLPSASLNREGFGMYEPGGGSAPDIAGKGVANPIAQILSAAMMLKYSFGMDQEYQLILASVDSALEAGARTADIASADDEILTTSQMGEAILKFINQ